jgi:hypothetical protein
MTAHAPHRSRTRALITSITSITSITLLAAGAAACTDSSSSTGLGTPQVEVPTAMVEGTGTLSELQQRRAAWVARAIADYRFQLRISCFCGSEITRPVLVEVRGGVVSKAWDLETAKPVAALAAYPTITQLFDNAIAERSREGFVTVTYDRATGIPASLVIGTLANDAGTAYQLGGLTRL